MGSIHDHSLRSFARRAAGLLAFAALAAGLAAGPLGCAGKTEEERLTDANRMLSERNVLGATIAFQEFLKKFPDSQLRYAAQFGLAQCYLNDRDWAKSRELLDSVIQGTGGPGSEVGFRAAGMKIQSYIMENKPAEALSEAVATSATLAAAPADVRSQMSFLVADLYIRNRQFPPAREILEASIQTAPQGREENVRHLESVSRLARTHLAENNPAAAMAAYEGYLAKFPESELEMELRKNLGRLQRQQGLEEAALAQFERTEVLARERLEKAASPDEKSIMMLVIADVLALRNDPDASKAMYRKIIDDFPMGRYRPLAMAQLAMAFEKEGDLESARAQYAQIADMYPNTPPAQSAMQQLQRMKAAVAQTGATTATIEAPASGPASSSEPADAPAEPAEDANKEAQ